MDLTIIRSHTCPRREDQVRPEPHLPYSLRVDSTNRRGVGDVEPRGQETGEQDVPRLTRAMLGRENLA